MKKRHLLFSIIIGLCLLFNHSYLMAQQITGLNNVSYSEGQSPIYVGPGVSVTNGVGYGGGYILFDLTNGSVGDQLALVSDADPNAAGAISFSNGNLYLGTGSGKDVVGSIDATLNGDNGKDLKINFTSNFSNSSFENGLGGWTVVNEWVNLGTTYIAGFISPEDNTIANKSGGDNDAPRYNGSWPTYFRNELSTSQYTDGNYSLRLYSNMTTTNGYDVVHGPYVYSSPFQSTAGDVIYFDWRAWAGNDAYDVFGYLLNTQTGATTIILNQTGSSYSGSSPWATASVTIPASGSYSFVFVSGTYDYSGGTAAGASLYIDNVRVYGDKVNDAVVSSIINKVTYKNECGTSGAARNLQLSVRNNQNGTGSASSTISIVANPPMSPSTEYTTNLSFPSGGSTPYADWGHLYKPFADPLPTGAILTGADLTFTARDQGWGGTGYPAYLFINDTHIGNATLWHQATTNTINFSGSFPNYVYGGTNNLEMGFQGYPGWQSFWLGGTLTLHYKIENTHMDIQLALGANGQITVTPQQVDPGYTDECSIVSRILSKSTFDCSNIGDNDITVTYTDNYGASSTSTATITITDETAPVVATQNVSIELDASGQATLTVSQVDNNSTDNCGIASYTLSKTSFSCSDIGENIVSLTVIDNYGNSASANAVVTVTDNTAPIVVTQDITVQLDANGTASIEAADIDAGSSDSCGIASLSLDVTSFDCSNIGSNTVTLTAIDVNGNTASTTATVTVIDAVAPLVITKDITVQLNPNGLASITPQQVNNGSSDACGIASMSLDITSFDCANVGSNTVTLTVVDVNGNSSAATTTVIVEDNIAPIATGYGTNYTAQYYNGIAFNTLAMTDQVPVIDNHWYYGSPYPNHIGVDNFSIRYTGTTVAPASGTYTFRTFSDDGIRLWINGQLIIDNWTYHAGTYNYATLYMEANQEVDVKFEFFEAGGYAIAGLYWASADAGINSYQPVPANSNKCKNITIQLDAQGYAAISTADVNPGFTDACGIASMELSQSEFDCSNVGTNEITLTVTDVNGNVSICSPVVTVEDNVPAVVLTRDITVQLDASGVASIEVADIESGSSDACGIASRTLDITSFDCSAVGTNTVTLTAVDVNGNVSSNTATVTIEDNVPAVVLTQDITVQLDASGAASIEVADIDAGSSDACGIESLTLDTTSFDCSAVGTNTVTLTAVDVNGNISSNTAIVTVEDNVPAVVLTQDITVQLDASGAASIEVADINAGSSDACGIESLTLDITSFDCSVVGANTVTLTAVDVNGNVSSNTATVTVEDNVPAVVLTQEITVQLDASGAASIEVADIDAGSSDACGIASLTLDITSFDCSAVGANTVTLNAVDANGNVSSNTAVVTVEDNVAPVVVTQDVIIHLDEYGQGQTAAELVDDGSTDACGIASIELSKTEFDCSNVGENTVVLTVTDVNGNVASAEAIVSVFDIVPPVAVCQPVTIHLDELGQASIVAADIDGGSNDACGIASLEASQTAFDCDHVGENDITLTVTDVNGNVSTCVAVVTVINDIPEINSFDVTTVVNIAETVFAEASYTDVNLTTVEFNWGNGVITAGSVDAASGMVYGDYVYPETGLYDVTVTITDVCGQTATETFSYIVIFDPCAGHVTGGGYFEVGKTKNNFGYNAKYDPETGYPKGNVNFKDKVAGYQIKADTALWLMVNNDQAIFSGPCTVNEVDGYTYIVSMIDGDVVLKNDDDFFRIIVRDASGYVVYDNQAGDDDRVRATELIDFGSLKIHKGCGNDEEDTLADNGGDDNNSSGGNDKGSSNPGKGKGKMMGITTPDVDLYPNPVAHNLNLRFKDVDDQVMQFDIVDMSGRAYTKNEALEVVAGFSSVDISQYRLRKGNYMMIIRNQDNSVKMNKPFMKE